MKAFFKLFIPLKIVLNARDYVVLPLGDVFSHVQDLKKFKVKHRGLQINPKILMDLCCIVVGF